MTEKEFRQTILHDMKLISKAINRLMIDIEGFYTKEVSNGGSVAVVESKPSPDNGGGVVVS